MKRWIGILLPVLVLAALIGWRVQQRKAAEAAGPQGGPRRGPQLVSVAPVSGREIVNTFDAIGNVEAPFDVKLAPKSSGRLDYLVVREGDPVKRGQVLARIDPSELEASVGEKQAALAQARYRLAQAEATEGSTDVSVTSDIREQEASVAAAQAVQKQATRTLSAEVAGAQARVTQAQGQVAAADAAIANARAALKSAQANLDNARSRYNRAQSLFQKGFTAAQTVDDALTEVKVQEGAVDVAQGQLNAAVAQRDAAAANQRAAEQEVPIARAKSEADIAAAAAGVQKAKAGLSAARANTAQKPAYRQNLAALSAAVAAAEAQLGNARAQLANTVLTSPVDGFVTARYMDPGSLASPSDPVLAVQAIRQVYIRVPVPEEVSRKVSPGMAAAVQLDALPGRAFTAKVAAVNPAADPQGRQFTMRLVLNNPRALVKPGMFARVSLVTERVRSKTVVPRVAVKRDDQGAHVVVVNNGLAEVRPVALGAGDADHVAVTKGVRPGEKVVTLSASELRDGQEVRLGGERPGRGKPGEENGRPGAPRAGKA